MNITFTDEELKAIVHNDYSIFDHELSAYELKAAVRQIVADFTTSGPIRQLKDEIECLKEEKEQYKNRYQAVRKGRFEKIEQMTALQKQIEELKSTIHYRELALDEAEKKRDELETKNRQLCNDLAGERMRVRNLEVQLEERAAEHAAVEAARKTAAYRAIRLED